MRLDHVISFSLYSSNPLYCEGALQNVELAMKFYREWVCRFYIDDNVPQDCVARLLDMGAQVIRVQKKLAPLYGRYWRFGVAADSRVSRYLIRDVDSRLNPRERAAVDEWILSGKSFHVMRDSFSHRTRMLGGMWGGSGGKLRNIAELIDNWGRFDQNGQCDQFMSAIIYPIIKNDYFCHDSLGHFRDEESHDFPAHQALEGTSFVGEIVKLDHHCMDIWRRVGELEDMVMLLEEELTRISQTTPTAANFFRSARPYLEALSPDLRGIVRFLQGYHQVSGGQYNRRFETFWNSWSWRSFRPIRNFIRRCRRLPPESKPIINSIYEAEEAIKSIKNSATWHITRPLRALRKLLERCFPS
jgi:hypothetical protein